MAVDKRTGVKVSTREHNMLKWCKAIFSTTGRTVKHSMIIEYAERAYANGMPVDTERELEPSTTSIKYSGDMKPMAMRRVLLTYMERELTEFFGGTLPEIPEYQEEKD
jgi:hypothetical protein